MERQTSTKSEWWPQRDSIVRRVLCSALRGARLGSPVGRLVGSRFKARVVTPCAQELSSSHRFDLRRPRHAGEVQQTPESSVSAFRSLLAARSLKCFFNTHSSADWKSGKPSVSTGREDFGLHFDGIDIKAQKARLIGNHGASDVTVFPTPAGLHFMEQTPFGNITFTTVFASRAPDGFFVAVSSRHMDLPGGPLPSQYHGARKVWQ